MTIMLFVTIGLLAVIDQLIKVIMQMWLSTGEAVTVIDGFAGFTYFENRGASFGMLQNMRWLFIIVTAAVIIYASYMLIKNKLKSVWLKVGVVFIIAGGLGNLIDRVLRGYVIDYIELLFMKFAIFNFADSLVTIGAAIIIIKLIIDLIGDYSHEKKNMELLLTDSESDE